MACCTDRAGRVRPDTPPALPAQSEPVPSASITIAAPRTHRLPALTAQIAEALRATGAGAAALGGRVDAEVRGGDLAGGPSLHGRAGLPLDHAPPRRAALALDARAIAIA